MVTEQYIIVTVVIDQFKDFLIWVFIILLLTFLFLVRIIKRMEIFVFFIYGFLLVVIIESGSVNDSIGPTASSLGTIALRNDLALQLDLFKLECWWEEVSSALKESKWLANFFILVVHMELIIFIEVFVTILINCEHGCIFGIKLFLSNGVKHLDLVCSGVEVAHPDDCINSV